MGKCPTIIDTEGYLKRKAENLATREDIAEITEKVEDVRTQYKERLENLAHQNRQILEQGTRRHQLRLAALDRRLEAHQQAYTLWRKLLSNVHNDEAIGSVVMECQDWWDKNCLYLDSEAREAFRLAYRTAFQHRDLLRARANIKDIEKNWSDVKRAGEVIVKAVELPTIRDLESEVIKLKEQ